MRYSAKNVADKITPISDSKTYLHLATDYEYKADMIEHKAIKKYMTEVNHGKYDGIKSLDSYLTNNEKIRRDKLLKKANVCKILAEKTPYKTMKERDTAELEAQLAKINEGFLNKTASEENRRRLKKIDIHWRQKTAKLPYHNFSEEEMQKIMKEIEKEVEYKPHNLDISGLLGIFFLILGVPMILPNITGRVVGNPKNIPLNFYGGVLILLGILSLTLYGKYSISKR